MSKSSLYSDSSSSSSSGSLSSLSSFQFKEQAATHSSKYLVDQATLDAEATLSGIEISYTPNKEKLSAFGNLDFNFGSLALKNKFMDMMKEAGLLKIFISQSDRSVSVLPSIDKATEPGAYLAQNGEVAINFGKENNAKAFKQKVFDSSLQGIADIYGETPHKIYFKKSLSVGKTVKISNPDFKFSFEDSLDFSYSDSSSSSSSESLSFLMSSTLSSGSSDSSSIALEPSIIGESSSHSE